MSTQHTREVYVLVAFRHGDEDYERGQVFRAKYETDRQRQEVNEMVHRGFLTLDVAEAKRQAEVEERRAERRRSRKDRG